MALQLDEATRVIDAIANFDYTDPHYMDWWKADVKVVAQDIAYTITYLLATGVLKYPDAPGESIFEVVGDTSNLDKRV